MRLTLRRKVDLPQPEGPIKEVIMPSLDVQVDVVEGLEGPVPEVESRVWMAIPAAYRFDFRLRCSWRLSVGASALSWLAWGA